MFEVTSKLLMLLYVMHSQELLVVYCNSQSELFVARKEESSMNPVCTKIGEYSCITGAMNCTITFSLRLTNSSLFILYLFYSLL